MITIRIHLLVGLLLLFLPAYGQQTGVELKVGYCSYAMHDLSKVLEDQKRHSNFELKTTADFPAFVTFGCRVFGKVKQLETGLDYSYLSTGGRVHYRDYSGQLGFEQIAVAHAVGLFVKGSFVEYGKFSLKGSLLVSLYASRVNFNGFLGVGDYQENERLATVSKSIVITPSLEPVFTITPWLYSGIRLGAGLDTKGALRLKDNLDARLVNEQDQPITSNWSGFRSELFVGILLPTQ